MAIDRQVVVVTPSQQGGRTAPTCVDDPGAREQLRRQLRSARLEEEWRAVTELTWWAGLYGRGRW